MSMKKPNISISMINNYVLPICTSTRQVLSIIEKGALCGEDDENNEAIGRTDMIKSFCV